MKQPLFSIIIPVYCGGRYADALFQTVKSQGLGTDDYELIFVDDASPDDTAEVIRKAIVANPDVDAQLIVHQRNKRQGGGRNTGIRAAKGQYVVFLDQDDRFHENALKGLKEEIIRKDISTDIIAVDYSDEIDGTLVDKTNYNNDQAVMSGTRYMQTQQVPWVPWCYVYNRDYVVKKGFSYQEGARFEDKDYVIKATVYAASIVFLPIKLVVHKVWTGQQSHVGSNFASIHDLFWISFRVREIAEGIKDDEPTKRAVLHHHWFGHRANMRRYLWRLPYGQAKEILAKFPAYTPCGDKLLSFSSKHPVAFARMLQCAKPGLKLADWVYHLIKK